MPGPVSKWTRLDWKKATPKDIQKYIDEGCGVNDEWEEGPVYQYSTHYPLELATKAKNLDAVKYLFLKGADPNAVVITHVDYKKYIEPLLLFASKPEILDLYLKNGADPYRTDLYKGVNVEQYQTEIPFFNAIANKRLDIVKKFLKQKNYKLPDDYIKQILGHMEYSPLEDDISDDRDGFFSNETPKILSTELFIKELYEKREQKLKNRKGLVDLLASKAKKLNDTSSEVRKVLKKKGITGKSLHDAEQKERLKISKSILKQRHAEK